MKKQEMQRRRREGLRENERGKQGQGEKVIKEEGTLKQVCQTEKGVGGDRREGGCHIFLVLRRLGGSRCGILTPAGEREQRGETEQIP